MLLSKRGRAWMINVKIVKATDVVRGLVYRCAWLSLAMRKDKMLKAGLAIEIAILPGLWNIRLARANISQHIFFENYVGMLQLYSVWLEQVPF